jgi:hypothetical protein
VDEAFNPVNIKTRANWRVRLHILGGGNWVRLLLSPSQAGRSRYGAEGDSAAPDEVFVV